MKKILVFSILLIFVSCFLYAVVIDKIVATVNGEPVTYAELDRILQPVYKRYKGEDLKTYKIHARRELLEQLIENKLILQKAKEDGISISEAVVEEELVETKEKFDSPEEFNAGLEREGLDIEQYKKELKEQLTVRAIIEREVMPKAKVSPKEIEEYYNKNKNELTAPEEIHLKHILKETKEEIDIIYKQLQEGREPLDAWVDLGFIPKTRLKPELLAVIAQLAVGQYSKIIPTEVGFYIILLEDQKPQRTITLQEAWEKIEDKLFRTKLQAEHKKWINSLKEKAHIEISE